VGNRDAFDFFEVHKVTEYRARRLRAGRYLLWTVYGYRRWPTDEYGNVTLTPDQGYGTTAIADLTTYEGALDLAIALAYGDEDRVIDMGAPLVTDAAGHVPSSTEGLDSHETVAEDHHDRWPEELGGEG
jgi:hypothetical protein